MRNKFIILYFLAFVSPTLLADTIFIQSKNITLEKKVKYLYLKMKLLLRQVITIQLKVIMQNIIKN